VPRYGLAPGGIRNSDQHVVELVDALDFKIHRPQGHVGSIPTSGTIIFLILF
jgi:hypothetical protein